MTDSGDPVPEGRFLLIDFPEKIDQLRTVPKEPSLCPANNL